MKHRLLVYLWFVRDEGGPIDEERRGYRVFAHRALFRDAFRADNAN